MYGTATRTSKNGVCQQHVSAVVNKGLLVCLPRHECVEWESTQVWQGLPGVARCPAEVTVLTRAARTLCANAAG